MAADQSLSEAGFGTAGPIEGIAGLIEPGSLLEATPECMVITAVDGRILFANRRLQELTGFDRGDLIDHQVEVLLTDGLSNATENIFEAQCRRAGADPIAVEVHLGHIDGPDRLLVVTLRDLTEIKEGREARFEAEAKYRALVDEIPAVVYLDPVDENSDSIYVSPQVTELIGVTPTEWLTDAYCWRRHVHPDDIDRVWDEYVEAYTQHTTLNHEYRMVHEDGRVKWVLEQATTVRDEQGEPWLIQGVIFDITRTQAGRGADRVPRLPRQPHAPAEPGAVRGDAGSVDRARPPARPGRRRDLPGPRQLQARERLARPRGRRPDARAARRPPSRVHARDRPRGPSERRRVPAAAVRPRAGAGSQPGTDAAAIVAESVATRVHEALREPFDLDGTEFYASASLGISLFPQDAHDAARCCRTPTPPCTRASATRRAATCCSPRTTATRWRAGTDDAAAARRRGAALGAALPADPRPGRRAHGRRRGPRPLAGSRTAASCRRASSSRWPRRWA